MKMSYIYFNDHQATPDSIREFVENIKPMFADTNIDEEWLYKKIESNCSVVVGDSSVLEEAIDHIEWFNPATNSAIRRDVNWHFWNHYKSYVEIVKGWPPQVVESLERQSGEILSRIEDPERVGKWDCRGMVVGSVQSGKTANYTALITKAADAGYKFIVVMAGAHNSLRSQTQLRLNEEFLGYDLDKVQKSTGAEPRIGVRKLFSDHGTVFTLTNSDEKGDFKAKIANQTGIYPANDAPPIILVVKKHVSILTNIISWIQSVISEKDQSGRDFIPNVPFLLIDDECDYASVNSGKVIIDEETGKPIDECDPTKTNLLIRKLLFLFEKSAYVGYTATPYANIFINEAHTHNKYGEELFPKNFIISLPKPSNYLGPEKVFGLKADERNAVEEVKPLPLTRSVDDYGDIIGDKHKKTDVINTIPESLKRSIKSFLLTCAARSIRQEGTPNNSMLIHVTRYVPVQEQIYQLVETELRHLNARIMSGEDLGDFRDIWENDFLVTTRKMHALGFDDATEHEWDEIYQQLYKTTRGIRVKLVNGTAKDVLDYKDVEIQVQNRIRNGESVPWEEKGLNAIVIGGDKLSRGLTLEGLTTSYYLRTSRMYDTLMQMGRWFGYRDGFNDLCRIYTTELLLKWYSHIAVATKELSEEIARMSAVGETPTNFGLKVRSHPGNLIVTSAGKSRSTTKMKLSYSGRISETIVFDKQFLAENKLAADELIKGFGRPHDNEYNVDAPRFQWKNVSSQEVVNFLHKYKINDAAMKFVKPNVLADYIIKQNENGGLTEWDVVLVSKKDNNEPVEIGNYKIQPLMRAPIKVTNDSITVKRLVSRTDESLDLSEDEKEKAKKYFDSNPNINSFEIAVRHVRPEKRGLLLLCAIQGKSKDETEMYGFDGEEVIGFAISFPESEKAKPVEYVVNPVWIKEEDHYA